MTELVFLACVFFVLVMFVAPWVDGVISRRRTRHAELARCGGRVRLERPTTAPRFDRDPSPRRRAS